MRGTSAKLLSGGLLAALFAWLVTAGGHTAVGQPALRGAQPVPKKGDKGDKEPRDDRSELDDNLPFLPPYESDAKKQIAAAREYLAFREPPYETICRLLQDILDSQGDSFFDIKYKVGDGVRVNRVSVKSEANRIISTFKPEGLAVYQQRYGGTAAAMLDEAIKANCDLSQLADLSQRYFHTRAGAEATVLIGTLYLERGNYLEAASAFERLLPRKDVDDLMTPRTLFKMALAFKRSADPRHAELFKGQEDKLYKAARDGIKIGRNTYPLDKIKAELGRPVELVRAVGTVGEWATRGGNPARSAVVDGGAPFLDKVFSYPLLPPDTKDNSTANEWIRGELDKLFARDRQAKNFVPLPGTFPVATADAVLFRGYDAVYSVATRDRVVGGRIVRPGSILWKSKTTAGLHQIVSDDTSDRDMSRDVRNWWTRYSTAGLQMTNVLYENPLIGSLAHDGQNAYFVDDLAVTPPPVFNNPNQGIMMGPQFRAGGELADMVRGGKLVAVDLNTGNIRWSLGRVKVAPPPQPEDGKPPLPPPPPLPNPLTAEQANRSTDAFQMCLEAVFLSPPLPLNGRLYVLIEQAGVVRLLCLDPTNLVKVPGPDPTPKPTLVWSQRLGEPLNTLPADIEYRRFRGAALAASDGIIVCPTNAGVVVAVDTMSRSLLWAYGYRKVEQLPLKGGIDPATGMPRAAPRTLETERWRAGGPIISGGRVVFTAYDSRSLDCLDLRTGRLLWQVPFDSSDLYVGGVAEGKVVVVGKHRVKAYHLTGEDANRRPRLAWESDPIPTPTGHGAVGRAAYYLPVRQDGAGKGTVPAAEIWAVSLADGKVASKTAARKRNDTAELARFGLGNLIFQGGLMFAQSPWEISAFPQLEIKIAEMKRLLDKNPNDPLGLLARGELYLDDGKLKAAIADFKAAQKNGLPVEKRPVLREKMYVAYTELLRVDFAAAESVLSEYEPLCEVPALGTETPEDRVKREDETKKRKRLYYYLLARGREAQGRLAEAFDHYLALAGLGDGQQLLDMPDEPNVQMQPAVWARGRIEGMIVRAAAPEARKALEVRVRKEWDQVKDGADLPRLREFVAVFGPFFATGVEAQFKLADVLLSTNNEADAREAQTHLSQVRATADDPAARARATEALAQLMVKSRQMEDAVGLYLQLGKEFPNVVVRDGKTGADFLNSLLTDKRLLPYLEPGRAPLPTRVMATVTAPAPNTAYGAQFEIEPPADLFPAYKRLRYVLDGRTGLYNLIAYDRATGAERMRFRGIQNPNIYSRNGLPIPWSRFVQGNGHLMLIQMGMTVYCFDLADARADKRPLWSENLLPDNQVQPNANFQIEVLPDGECNLLLTAPTGQQTRVPMGRPALLQAGAAVILTPDGLKAIEPLTRRVLWVRRGVPEQTFLYGDGRYILLVEKDGARQPRTTRLIRAVDGLQVEGAPDAAPVLRNAKYRILGRRALITSGTGDEKRAVRLHDLATGKDVWKREYDPGAVPLTAPLNDEWAGFLSPDGTAEVLSVRTGEVVATLKVDAKNRAAHVKPCVAAQVLADADRFYLFLDRDPAAAGLNGNRAVNVYNTATIRYQKVNGPLYAFARGTGKRLWFYDGLFDHQWLLLDQFAELPVIVGAAPTTSPNGITTHPVVVIEKERGRLVLNGKIPYNGQPLYSMTIDPKNGTISLNRDDTRVLIQAEESNK